MTTTTRYVSWNDGSLVSEPGDYDILRTTVRIANTRKSNGFTVDEQNATIVHTVAPRSDGAGHLGPERGLTAADEPEPEQVAPVVTDEALRARAEKAEQTITALVERFTATFQPDFGGVDWRDNQAIQDFARDFIRITHANASTPATAG